MDVIPSGGHEDTIVVEARSLSNHGSDVESPVFKLPTELILLVFQQFASCDEPPITLTQTCRRWRHIAVNNASLWTNIHIKTRLRPRNLHLDHFLFSLGTQLDRTANLPLDVIWEAEIGDGFFVETLQLLREKAPFPRWRTLGVHISGTAPKDPLWLSTDAFMNLESLRVWHGTENAIISAIDRTITSRLKVLDLGTWPSDELERLTTSFANSFTHISTFCFDSIPFNLHIPFPHDNNVNLRLRIGGNHPFPRIRKYEVLTCIVDQSSDVDLGNLTTLIIADFLIIISTCLFLQALRELKLGYLDMDITAKIEAPVLDTLHFMANNQPEVKTRMAMVYMEQSILRGGYLLSPNCSIITDSPLPSTTLIPLLTKSPKVTTATLRFDDWADAQVVLGRLLGVKTENDSYLAENEALCPRLSELRVNLDWEFSEPSTSKAWLLDALKSRMEDGYMSPLSLYVGWKGEGTYVLLTGG